MMVTSRSAKGFRPAAWLRNGLARAMGSRRGVFGKDTSGAVAIEFAAISIPFFGLLYGVLELGLMFFAGAVMDTGADRFARKVKTGQAQTANTTHSQAITEICSGVLELFSCSSGLHLYVSVVTDLSSITAVQAVDSSGNMNSTVIHNMGTGGDYVLIQSYLPWPSLFMMLGSDSAKLSSGDYLLGSTFFFRNEPFT